MSGTVTIGIDTGVNGGIAVVRRGRVVYKSAMPTLREGKSTKVLDAVALRRILVRCIKKYGRDKVRVYIEDLYLAGRLNKGVKKFFEIGGMTQGICTGLNLGYILVRPNAWTKTILKGYPKKHKKDKPSVRYVRRRFPKLNLTATERSTKIHDGITDAICIALYGEMN